MIDYFEFFDGICLFCGREAEEKFESGSCESYLVCNCNERKEAENSLSDAKNRYNLLRALEGLERAKEDKKITEGIIQRTKDDIEIYKKRLGK